MLINKAIIKISEMHEDGVGHELSAETVVEHHARSRMWIGFRCQGCDWDGIGMRMIFGSRIKLFLWFCW